MSTPKLVITPKVLNVSSRTGKINFDYRLDNFTDPAVSSVAMEIYFSSELQIDVNAITIGDNVGTISTGGRIAVADGSNADSDSNTNNSVILTFQPLTTSSTDKSFITIPFVTTGAFDGQAMVNFIARSSDPTSLSVDAISSVVINNQTPAIIEVGPGQTYTTIQAAINAASDGDVIRVLSGIYNENLTINKSITLEGPNKGIKPTTPDINLNGGIQVNQGYRSNVEAWIKGTITVAADGVTIDGFRLRNENGPLQWDGTPDNFKLLNNYVTGYNADKGPRFGDANSNNPTEVVRGWQIDGNYIGGLLGGGGTGGSMYLAGLGNSSIDNNTFWRPRAAHLYLASLTNVTIKGNKFYHGLHAGGANYDGFNQFFSGSGYGGYGYGGYGGYGGSYGGGYGRNYWLELKGTNDGVNIVENSGEYNSGGIQLYGEVSDSFQFNNITIEKNTFPANNFINAYIEPSPNNLSGLIPAVMATARVVDNGPSGSNLVVRNNTIEKDLSQLKFTKDHTSSIDVRGNFNGVTIENNNLTSVGTNGGVSLITGLSFYGDLSETVLIKDNGLNGADGTRGNAAYYGIDFIPNPALLTPAVDGYGTYTGSNLKIEGNTIGGWQVGVVLRNAGQITGNINIAGNTLSNNSFNVFDGINPTITPGQIPYAENQLQGVVLGTVSASDNLPNTDNVGIRQYAIVSGNESGFFSINNSTGQVTLTAAGIAAAANNFETLPNTFDLGITVTDAGGLTATQTVTFTVTNVNEAPSFPAPTATFSTPENSTAVETITAATDPDAGDTLTYTLSGADADKFNLDATSRVLSFKAAPNFEAPGSAAGTNAYSVTVTATDAGGLTAIQTVTVDVTDVPEVGNPPEITSSTFSLVENTTAVGTITATDADGDSLTYSISGGADQNLFTINPNTGVLSFNTPPNFEAPGDVGTDNVYNLQVQVTDGNNPVTQDLIITVTNVNEAPSFAAPTATFSTSENSTSVGTITTATDPDAGDTLTYSLSGADADKFNFDATSRVLSFKTAPNFEAPGSVAGTNTYSVTVTATDAGGLTAIQTVTVDVTDVPEVGNPPEITSSTFSVAENTTAVGTITATDADGDSLTYSISGGADQNLFTINPNTGVLSFNTPPNFEAPGDVGTDNVYNLQVQVTDGNNPVTQDLIITVTNVNEAPSFADTTAIFSTPENTTSVGTITAATDPDAGDTLTYSLSGADADKFNFDPTSRVLSFKTAPNFEAPGSAAGTNAYSVTVTATDAGGLTATQTVTVNVTDVDDTPPNPPTINNFTDNVTPLTGTFNNGSRTNDPTPTLNITAEAASTIRVFLPGGQEVSGSVVTTGTTGNISTYTFTPSTSLSQDNYSFTATATDAAGNISNQSNPFTLTVDTTPPSAPIIVNFTDDVVPLTGTLDSGSVTNDSTPTLNITAESGSTVQIFRNGFSYGTAQESSTPGTYTFTTATLGSFTHQFTAQATDAAGNVGPSSATFSLTVEPPTYRRYNFTYSYGNGDSYSGYVYELEGTYSVGRLSGNFSNETNLATPTGFYTIDSLGETTTDSSFNKRVYLTRYTDSDTGFGSTTNLWPPSNSVSSYSGLGSEYGYAYDSNFFSADPYFTNYFEADLISNNVYFEFTYYYGASANSDYYKGYGYASRDYINAPGRYNALSSAQNDTGSTGYYDVTSVQSIFDFGLRNVNTYIWVNEYFDLETDQDGTGIGGYGKADYVWSYGGTTGLGSEEGYAYNLAFEGGDNQFNHLKSADIGTEKTFLSIRNQGNAWLQSRFEGNQGTTTNYNFEVVRRGSLNSPLSVNWTTQDFFSLSSANDFVGNTFPSGTVTFAPGESVKPFTVSVQGDNTIEFAEWFQARITNPNPSSITISQDYALARILNDDGLFWGWNFGDPHLVTLDGLAYDFMAVGEFVLIETTPGSDNPFQVQVRYEPFPGSDVASIATRMAVKLGERKIELRPGESPLLIDGSPVTIDPTLDGLDIDGDGSLDIERQSIQNGSKYVVTLNSLGEQVDLDIYDTFMDVNMLVAQSPEGSTRGFRGLLGDRNNNSADDLRGRDGTLYAQPVSFDQLYGTFANSWRVDPVGGTDGKDSLFTYSAGQGVGSFNREGFPKGVIDLNQVPADLLAAAQNAAVGITDPVLREAAIYDYFLTGDRNFISSAADSPAEPNRDQPETIDLNTAPVVTSVGVGATLESFTEGNSGSREVTFRIWRTNSTQTLTIDYRLEGSINAADLAPGTPFSGSVDFAQGETEKLVTVTVLGDRDIETDERLVLALAAGAQSRTIGSLESTIIAAGQAVTTITSDDLPPVTINQISGNNVVNAAEKIAGVSITGNATGLEQVRVTVAGLSKTVSVNAGTWSANFASQELPGDGSYNVEAIGIDSSGNQIDPVTRTLVLDATPPAPPVINPITGDNIINPAETTSGITITGTAEENTRVQLAFGGVTRTVTAIGGQWSTIIAANQLPNVNQALVTATATDTAGNTSAIAVREVRFNQAPSFAVPTATFDTAENNTSVGTITAATDPDTGDTLTYTLSGADADKFNIDSSNRFLSFKTAPNFEAPSSAAGTNAYSVTVTATDGGGLTATQTVTVNVTDVVEVGNTPEITSSSTFSLVENTTAVGTITATDADGDSLTYSISGGLDQSLFTINPNTGDLSFNTRPNFEAPGDNGTNNVYNLQIQVTDGNNPVTQDLIITVTNVNEAPSFAPTATFSTPENTVLVGSIAAIDPDAGDTLTYTLSGADAAKFNVDSGTRFLSFNTAPNFEAPGSAAGTNAYSVTVTATDARGSTATQTVTVNVTNVNEAPSFAAPTASFSTAENSTTVGTITAATDPDAGDTLTYTLSGADADKFNIDSSNRFLSFKTPPNFEAPGSVAGTNTYSVTVTATDAGGLTAIQTVTVDVTDVPEVGNPPEITSSTFSVAENTTAVGTITATDADGDSLTYSISGGADQNLFTINPNTGVLSFNTPPNFEAPGDVGTDNVYNLQVEVTDGNNPVTQDLIITVTNVNEAPSFATLTATFSTPENSTTVGTITAATDPDAGDTLTYTLSGADADKFNIDSSNRFLSFKTPPNFEAPGSVAGTNTYSVTVTATDADGLTATQTVTVNVTDVQEVGNPPEITSSTFSVAENTTAVGTITATDADGDSLTYSISGGADQNLFTINPNTGVLSFNTPPNFEAPGDVGTDNVYNLQVQVTDGNNPVTQDLIITVTNVNEAPSFAAPTATFSTPENSTTVGTITAATDPDAGDTLTYTLSGADADKFNIDSSNRFLSFKTPPNFEAPGSVAGTNTYSVTVTATDAGGLTATQTVTVNVTDVAEVGNPPVITSSSTFSLVENTTAVGTITATDADGDSLTYSISGGADRNLFTINPNTGVLSFNTPPNFEAPGDVGTDNVYNLQVQVTDGNNPVTQDLIITVTNVNEAPVFSSFSFSVPENRKLATKITVQDPEGDAITFALAGVDANLLSLDPQTGELTFNELPDFEKPGDNNKDNTYEAKITVTDSSNLSVTGDISIQVTNVNEAPIAKEDFLTIFSATSGSIEPLKNDEDPDQNDQLKISSVTDGKHGKVEINVNGDQLKYTLLDAKYTGDDVFTYTISDKEGLTATANVRVNVTASNVIPAVTPVPVNPGNPLIPNEAGSLAGIVDQVSFNFLPGYNPTQARQTLQNTLGRTSAAFNNLFGLYEIDDATGLVNGIAPGAPGYAKEALSRAVSSFAVRAGGSGNGITGDVVVNGGKIYAPFVIANGGNLFGNMQDAINTFFQLNAGNSPATAENYTSLPVAYFSFGAANPDGAAHIRSFGNNIFGFEDLPSNVGVSDYDFNDTVFSFG